jgi:hypothetical protein
MEKSETVNEEKFKIDLQWYYRGNRSPKWLYVASRPDGSCQDGICEEVPREQWALLEHVSALSAQVRELQLTLSHSVDVDWKLCALHERERADKAEKALATAREEALAEVVRLVDQAQYLRKRDSDRLIFAISDLRANH